MHVACVTRRAVKSDAAAACEVVRRSVVELCVADHRGDCKTLAAWLANKTTAHFEDWIASERHVASAAERQGAVVGFGLMNLSGVIELLYVSPDARFSGVSKALLSALEAEAVGAGIRETQLESTITALRFYASAGYSRAGDATRGSCAASCYPLSRHIGRSEAHCAAERRRSMDRPRHDC